MVWLAPLLSMMVTFGVTRFFGWVISSSPAQSTLVEARISTLKTRGSPGCKFLREFNKKVERNL
ncbi:MAG: hypothetical protein OXE53_11005, partial [Deltaproteobacteria bacterium]|nr:hypothetical protein [Deltaproteobacteria bacterium]